MSNALAIQTTPYINYRIAMFKLFQSMSNSLWNKDRTLVISYEDKKTGFNFIISMNLYQWNRYKGESEIEIIGTNDETFIIPLTDIKVLRQYEDENTDENFEIISDDFEICVSFLG